MPDNKSLSGGQDRKRINVNEDYEVRDWAKKFDISPEKLKEAVAAGPTRSSAPSSAADAD